MAAQRYYYSDSITDFLSRSNNEIVGALTLASQHDVNDETSKSWVEENEAAIALYEENTVEDITKHGGDIDKASVELCKIIDHCRAKNRKAICFITGVPGAGKTLIGLNTAIDQFNRGEKAVYLSGNFPLVEVLQEALARDYVRRDKIRAKDEGRKACTKAEAKSCSLINAIDQEGHDIDDYQII